MYIPTVKFPDLTTGDDSYIPKEEGCFFGLCFFVGNGQIYRQISASDDDEKRVDFLVQLE